MDVELGRIVNVKDGHAIHQVPHVVDQIQHPLVQRRVVVRDEGTIEYLLPFHNYIT